MVVRAISIALLSVMVSATVVQVASTQSSSDRYLLRFVVSTPPGAAGDEISIALSLDGWNEAGRPLKRVAGDLYVGEWTFESPPSFEYKFRRGRSWAGVEKSAAGAEIPNREFKPSTSVRRQVVFHQVERWADQSDAPPIVAATLSALPTTPPLRVPSRTGDIRVLEEFESPQLHNRRTVLIYLPLGYEKSTNQRFPVLYMHDGQNVFDASTSFTCVEWGVDEACERLIAAGELPPIIVVAIYNNAARMNEYTQAVDAERGGGHGDAYVDFIADTLKPYMDRTYRTRAEREHTAIAGSSLGGLISLYAIQRRPEVFGAAGVVSPALFWADHQIFKLLREKPLPAEARIWLDIGTEEGREGGSLERFSRAVQDCRDLVALFESQGRKPERDFHYEQVEGGRHNEAAWAARIDLILKFLFTKAAPSPRP
ncbi:MAG: alpha/beta hydrolase-fold protein [Phycisphaerae bacterium]